MRLSGLRRGFHPLMGHVAGVGAGCACSLRRWVTSGRKRYGRSPHRWFDGCHRRRHDRCRRRHRYRPHRRGRRRRHRRRSDHCTRSVLLHSRTLRPTTVTRSARQMGAARDADGRCALRGPALDIEYRGNLGVSSDEARPGGRGTPAGAHGAPESPTTGLWRPSHGAARRRGRQLL